MIELYHDDCFDVFPKLAGKSIDLVLCDMPYGTTACKWDTVIDLELVWRELDRITVGNSAVVLTAAQPFTSVLISSNLKRFKYCWYWRKSKATGHLNAKIQPLRVYEDVCVFYNKQPTYNAQLTEGAPYKGRGGRFKETCYRASTDKRNDNSGFRYPNQQLNFLSEQKPLHPTQKPVALMEYLIKTYSNEGDTVLDFCMGSGTTGVACKNLNRSFVGVEKDEKYFNIAKDRIGVLGNE